MADSFQAQVLLPMSAVPKLARHPHWSVEGMAEGCETALGGCTG